MAYYGDPVDHLELLVVDGSKETENWVRVGATSNFVMDGVVFVINNDQRSTRLKFRVYYFQFVPVASLAFEYFFVRNGIFGYS